ncbi:MAG: hypothetical protein R3A12_00540 [Ignavibacteria bacterium]
MQKRAFPIELRRVYEKIVEKHSAKNDAELNNILASFNIESKVKRILSEDKTFFGK